MTGTFRGFFAENKSLFKKHFGLDVFITHNFQSEAGKFAWNKSERNLSNRSTSAYLTLPSESHYRDEFGHAFPIAMPQQLSQKSLGRFIRAMKLLKLILNPNDEARRPTLAASPSDMVAHKAMKQAAKANVHTRRVLQPELMFLVRMDNEENMVNC